VSRQVQTSATGGPGAALVVGLGASAGGLEPLQEFLVHVPAASGLVFVVIQHLEPNHPSMLAELLARHTAMPVLQASDGLPPEPDHVYVIAPGTLLTIDKGVLRVVASQGPSSSLIDAFFHSLAQDQGEQAVGALFSGAGHDGTVGLRAIKEHGGLTLAQPPETATHDCMLQSAIGAGLVDHVVPVAQMPAIISEHAEHLTNLAADAADLDEQLAAHLGKICALIHQRTGHDFSRYKEGTLLRRMRRRMQLHHLDSVGGYLQFLEKDSAEADGLLKDLLIGVTQFFRDPDAFQSLAQQIIPRIVQGKSADAPIRIWVPGCASGEEAYSIAILLREHLDRLETRRFVQIFATDLDAAMLGEARHGRYPADIADQVSPERLARFFVRDPSNGSGRAADFQAVKELREMCIFSEHSLIRDPPFSQLDLISCRNVLIYLSAELQKKLVPLFHYALRPGGFLFLGPSEGISGSPELFEPTDKRNRIFRRKETVNRPVVEFPLASRSAARASGASPSPQGMLERRAQTPHEKIGAAFERTVLEEYAAPSAVINESGDVLFVAGPLSRHLQLPAGALTTTNLLEAFRGNLRQELRMALRAAGDKRRKVVRKNISVESEDSTRRVHLTVRPMPAVEPEAGLFLVTLQEMEPPEENGPEETGASEVAEPAVEQLENELRTTRAELKTTVEELESANEEMKSSNEELISTNEELQSANEEMQTSKEELQSLNEELETVNTELRQKVDELGAANSDLQNLFVATEIATIFLDRSLRVAKFTPAATALFHLIETDVGRPLADFAQRFAGQDLASDAQEVLRILTPIERQVRSAQGAWFVLRVVPYRTVENLIAGVVVTFVDVSQLKRAEDALRQTSEREHFLAEVVENASTPFGVGAPDGSLLLFNRAFAELTGYSREELEQRRLTWATDLTPPEWREREMEILSKASRTGEPVRYEKEYIRKDGSRVPVELFVQPVLDGQGQVVHYRSFLSDISERKRAEAALRQSEDLLSFSLATAKTGAWDLDLVDHTAHRSLQHDQIFGYQELLPQWTYEMFIEHVLPEDREAVDRNFRQAIATRGDWSFECRILRHDGVTRWIWAAGRHRVDETGQPRRMAGIVQDITERKQAEAALRESHDRTSAILESIADAFYSLDDEWRFVVVNPAAERAPFGRPASELLGKVIWDVFPAIPGTRIYQHYLDAVQKRSHEHYEAQSPLNGRWYEVFMFPRTGGLDVYMRDITKRKGAEEALRLSEEKFAKAFHGNTAAMAITRLHDGLFIDVNQRYLEITGWARDEVVGDKSPRLNIWRDPKDRDRFVRELQQHGMIRNAEFTFSRKGGGEWTGLVSSEVSMLGGEQVIINSITDITERKKAEEALRESELRFRLALRNAPVSVAAQDRELKFIWAYNQRTARPEEIVGRSDEDIFTPEEAARITAIKRRVLDEGIELRAQMWFDRPNGRVFLDICWEPLRDQAGRVTGVATATVDLTPIKLAEDSLKESEGRFRTMANAIPQLAWMANPDGYITWYNQRWYEYTGTTAEQMEGWGWQRVHDPGELPRVLERWKGSIASGELFDMVFPLRGADGVFRPFLTRILPLKDADGRVVQWFGTNTDISERMKAEEALRVANAQLAEADQRKNEFLAVLSHELRNPLTPIRNSLYILERVTPGGDQARRAQEVIGRQSGQLARLVDDLLDVTRISRNKIQLQHGPLDLNELVRRTVEDHHSLFEGKGIAVETALAEQRLPMSGDAARLAQMVGNLLQNAAKFTPAGGRVAVSTAVAPSGGRAILRISDNGVGIEPAMLTRLFQPFTQAEATLDRSKGGLGLGLALVKGLVEMHGGDVRAHSDGPGRGAEFVVELPLEATSADQGSPTAVGAKPSRRRVLIIEDNIDAADSLREVLAFGDHVVEVAYNGPEGLARAREFKPEVVLCDIGLPGMDGFEVARAFRADEALKGTYLVALSGYALPEDLQRAQEAGFDRHLAKPPSPEKIEEALASGRSP
jgi:two-component system, chemotaxis family, CheB/CheR fusion protein